MASFTVLFPSVFWQTMPQIFLFCLSDRAKRVPAFYEVKHSGYVFVVVPDYILTLNSKVFCALRVLLFFSADGSVPPPSCFLASA